MKLARFTRVLPTGFKIPIAVNPEAVQFVQPSATTDKSAALTFLISNETTVLQLEDFSADVVVVGGYAETIRNLESKDE